MDRNCFSTILKDMGIQNKDMKEVSGLEWLKVSGRSRVLIDINEPQKAAASPSEAAGRRCWVVGAIRPAVSLTMSGSSSRQTPS